MDDVTASAAKPNFRMKLWRGERMCLIGFDVDAPEPDRVGFAIECKPPGAKRFSALLTRLAFSDDEPVTKADEAVAYPTNYVVGSQKMKDPELFAS